MKKAHIQTSQCTVNPELKPELNPEFKITDIQRQRLEKDRRRFEQTCKGTFRSYNFMSSYDLALNAPQ